MALGAISQAWRPRCLDSGEIVSEIPLLIWRTLYARGQKSPSEALAFLNPSLKDLKNPFVLDDMQKAVERLIGAWRDKEPVCVYADFDMDGTSGLALLKAGLENLGFKDVRGYQPKRLTEGYGVHVEAVREIFAAGARLLVTVDVGITATDAIEEAERLGMNVILTDHHLPGRQIPRAFAVINPNKGDCPSMLGHLSGAGVAFYLYLALRSKMKELGLADGKDDPKDLLDCFVIGTLTDMVPLVGENRVLVKHGLKTLAKTRRPGLKYLLENLSMNDRQLTGQDVGIRFAPKLNALSRMETGLRPIDIFFVEDRLEAQALAQKVLAINDERVQRQKFAESKAEEELQRQRPEGLVWLWSREFHRGVIGLVATRLAKEWGVPAFVGSESSEGQIVGSSRLPPGSSLNLVEALEFCSSSLKRFGGHPQAAGFELLASEAESFSMRLREFFAHKEGVQLAVAPLFYDAEAEIEEFTPEFMRWFEHMGPFGSQFEVPLYRISSVKLNKVRELRGGHLKLEIASLKSSAKMEAMWFSPSDKGLCNELSPGVTLDFLAEVEWNHFRGQKTLQLLIRDLRLVGRASLC